MISLLFLASTTTIPAGPHEKDPSENTGPGQPGPRQIYATSLGLTATVDDWENYLDENPELAGELFPTLEEAGNFVMQHVVIILGRKLLYRNAAKAGILDSEKGRARLLDTRQIQVSEWVNNQILPQMFEATEEEIMAEDAKRERRPPGPDRLSFRQIYLNTRGLDETEHRKKVELAAELVRRLREDPGIFSKLALEYSESATGTKDELYENVTPKSIVRSIQEPLWRLQKGETSDVLTSLNGLHIFRVEERLAVGVDEDHYESPEYINSLRDVIIRRKVKEYIQELVRAEHENLGLVFHEIPDKIREDTVMISGRYTLTGKTHAMARNRDLSEAPTGYDLFNLYVNVRKQYVLSCLAEDNGWVDDPAFIKKLEPYIRETLLDLLTEDRIEKQGGISDDDVSRYYEENKDELYVITSEHMIRECRLDPNLADSSSSGQVAATELADILIRMRAEWEKGSPFEELIRQEPLAVKAGEGGLIRTFHPPMLVGEYEQIRDLGIGEVSQLIRTRQGVSLLQLISRRLNDYQPLSEMEESIRVRIHNRIKDQINAELTSEVMSDIRYTFPEGLISNNWLHLGDPAAPPSG